MRSPSAQTSKYVSTLFVQKRILVRSTPETSAFRSDSPLGSPESIALLPALSVHPSFISVMDMSYFLFSATLNMDMITRKPAENKTAKTIIHQAGDILSDFVFKGTPSLRKHIIV